LSTLHHVPAVNATGTLLILAAASLASSRDAVYIRMDIGLANELINRII